MSLRSVEVQSKGRPGCRAPAKCGSVASLHEQLRVLRSTRVPRDAFFVRGRASSSWLPRSRTHSLALHGGSPHERSHGESSIDPDRPSVRSEQACTCWTNPGRAVDPRSASIPRPHARPDRPGLPVRDRHALAAADGLPGATIYRSLTTGPRDRADAEMVRITSDFLGDRTSPSLDCSRSEEEIAESTCFTERTFDILGSCSGCSWRTVSGCLMRCSTSGCGPTSSSCAG